MEEVTIPAPGRDLLGLSAITSLVARSVSPRNTGSASPACRSEVGEQRPERSVPTTAPPSARGEGPLDEYLPEFARFAARHRCGAVRIGVMSRQQIVGLGDGPADFMLDPIADGPLIKAPASHQAGAPITAFTSRNSWKPNWPHSRPLPDFL